MNESVSMIVPVYNAMPYFPMFLESLCEQTWRPLECIFADDGSTDGSAEFLAEFMPKLREAGIVVKCLSLPHGGQAAAVNAALKEVHGEFLTWCDSDDRMMPRCVEAKVLYLREHPEIGMVRNDGLVFDGDTGTVLSHSAKEADRKTQWIFDGLLDQTVYCYAGCYMVRMDVFLQGYPDREIPLSPEGQNLQLLLPSASRTQCGFIPEVLHHYYRRSTGHSGRARSFTENRDRAMNFIDLTRRILDHCECDREVYEKKLEELRKTRIEQLKYSLLLRAKEEIRNHESRNSDLP
ncbi:MAG: glycosyltransferase family 2 protein [Lachnospiraceae bacterium]|nr:glycosyltransferase family 2 protein [Lachnospiraceae bacterium]